MRVCASAERGALFVPQNADCAAASFETTENLLQQALVFHTRAMQIQDRIAYQRNSFFFETNTNNCSPGWSLAGSIYIDVCSLVQKLIHLF